MLPYNPPTSTTNSTVTSPATEPKKRFFDTILGPIVFLVWLHSCSGILSMTIICAGNISNLNTKSPPDVATKRIILGTLLALTDCAVTQVAILGTTAIRGWAKVDQLKQRIKALEDGVKVDV